MKIRSTGVVLFSAVCAALLSPAWADEPPKDQPYQISENRVDDIEKLQQPYIEQARNTYPQAKERFLSGLPQEERFYMTVKLRDSNGSFEAVFVAVKSISDGMVNGVIANQIELVTGFKKGQSYSFPEGELIDWTIVKENGTEEGNFVGKFMDEYQAKRPVEIALQYADANAEAEKLGAMLYEAETHDQLLEPALVDAARSGIDDFCKFKYKPVQIKIDGEIITYLLGFSDQKGSVVFGRHYKITSSGKSVSTVTCYESGKSREKPVALMITQLVAPSPTEFQVYLSLKYGLPLYVGTKEGLWLVNAGKIEFKKLMN